MAWIQVSTGSACSTTKMSASPIAQALSLSDTETKRLIRVSSFQSHTKKDWSDLISAFQQAAEELDNESAGSGDFPLVFCSVRLLSLNLEDFQCRYYESYFFG